MADIIRFGERGPSREELQRAAEAARAGRLLAFPTDTVYGLGSSALSADAARRIYALKGRDRDKPLPLLVASADEARRWTVWTPAAEALARRCWPGPLTLVLEPTAEGRALESARGGSLAVRVPDHPVLLEALSLSGVPWASTSANLSGAPALTDGEEVLRLFAGSVDLVLCGGRPRGRESTVVDARASEARVLREGALSEAEVLDAARQEA